MKFRVTLSLLVICLLLTGCVTRRHTTTVTKAPPSSKPYTVYGKRYEPLKNPDGFVQDGIALKAALLLQ